MIKIKPFKYLDFRTPEGYSCGVCGANDKPLFREYQNFMEDQRLFCESCALDNQKITIRQHAHTIGWLVAAVPTEKGDTFWGYTSIPDDGVKWWDALDKK